MASVITKVNINSGPSYPVYDLLIGRECPIQNLLYRVIQDIWILLQELISLACVIKKVNINSGPIFNGYGVMGVF